MQGLREAMKTMYCKSFSTREEILLEYDNIYIRAVLSCAEIQD